MNDIWSSGILTFDSPLKDLLDTNNYTLEDLLDEDELLQEVKGCHPQLKSFFNEESNVAGLIRCLLRTPPPFSESCEDESNIHGRNHDNDVNDNIQSKSSSENIDSDGNQSAEFFPPDNTNDGSEMSDTSQSESGSTKLPLMPSPLPPSEPEGGDASFEEQQDQDAPSLPNDTVFEETAAVTITTDDGFLSSNETVTSLTDEVAGSTAVHAAGATCALTSTVSTSISHNDADDDRHTSANNGEKETSASTSTSRLLSSDEEDKNIGGSNSADSSSNQPQEREEKPIMGEWLLDNITEKIESSNSKGINDGNQIPTSSPSLMTKEEYDKIYTRYPYIACEVICCEIDDILDIIVYGTVEIDDDDGDNGDATTKAPHKKKKRRSRKQSILDMLFSLLYTTPPSQLDDRRAGYLEKILSVLFRTRPKAMETYLNGDHLIYLPHCEQSSSSVLEYMNSNNKSTSSFGVRDTHDIMHADNEKEIKLQKNEHNAVTTVEEEEEEEREDMTIHRGGGLSLLDALFNHLHSNSISQIVQRLLMPKPPKSDGGDNDKNESESPSNGNAGEDNNDDDEYDDENLITSGVEDFGNINCNWSDGEYALNLLLGRLSGETDDLDDLLGGDSNIHDTNYEGLSNTEENDNVITRFDCSQHASEILIAIIQHSTLSSNVMRILTRADVLSKLIECSCSLSEAQKNSKEESNVDEARVPEVFSRHESTMTTAMSVLETLVLQLGGYGTVPTSPTCSDNDQGITQESGSTENMFISSSMSNEVFQGDSNSQPGNICPSTAVPIQLQGSIVSDFAEANSSSLIEQLPLLLRRLSKLLRHPDTENWKSQVQYSNQPQQLLGVSRLRIVRLIESLVLLGKKNVDHILCQSNCLEICLDLFWEFPWCSMLHQSVANLLVHVLEGGEDRSELQHYFLYDCNLMKRLMHSFNFSQNLDSEKLRDEDMSPPNISNENDADYESLLEMKNCQIDTSSGSSSLDAERGSITSEEENDIPGNTDETDLIPVSDDDVDAAMEQEEQMEKLTQGESDEALTKYENSATALKDEMILQNEVSNDEMTITSTNKSSAVETENSNHESAFRTGYMGHVIIICQALVHACGSNDETNNNIGNNIGVNSNSNGDGTNIKNNTSTNETVVCESSPNKEDPSNSSNVTCPNKLTGTQHNQTSRILNENMEINPEQNSIMGLLRGHVLYSQWLAFVTSTLAAETAVQSTPLGGCNNQNESSIIEKVDEPSWSNGDLVDHDINDNSRGTYTGDGAIDLDNNKFDDTEVDIAESLFHNLPPINGVEEGSGQGSGRHRRKGVLGGEGARNGSGSEFGTVVQIHQQPEYYQYKFDDPLGQLPDQFPENMTFDNGNNESDDNDIESEVPVMDLFTGNLNFDDANDQNDDTGWANFDEGFAECTANGDTEIIDSSPDPFGPSTSPLVADDLFDQDSQFTASFPDEEPLNKLSVTSHSHGNDFTNQ